MHRRLLRIPDPAPKVPPPRQWSAEEIALLGKYTDPEVARRLGLKVKAVRWMRHAKLRIPPVRPVVCKRWTPAEDQLLGKVPDEEVARRLNCAVTSVGQRRRRLGLKIARRTSVKQ